jgi:hypothetical protein
VLDFGSTAASSIPAASTTNRQTGPLGPRFVFAGAAGRGTRPGFAR